MSEYHTCQTAIKVEDREYLKEAIKMAARKLWHREISDQDIEFHQEAVPLIGYKGDIRDQKANVVLRGSGAWHHNVSGRNVLPSLWNDWGMIEDGSGHYQAHEQEFSNVEVKQFVSLVKASVSALKVQDAIKEIQETKPGTVVFVAGQEIPVNQLASKVQDYFIKGTPPPVKVSVRQVQTKSIEEYFPEAEVKSKEKKKSQAKKTRHQEFEG